MSEGVHKANDLVRRRLWVIAGSLAITYVVLAFVGVVFEYTLELGASRHDAVKQLVQSSLTRNYAGGYIEYLSCLVFLVAALLIARLLRGAQEDDTSGWLSSCISSSAVVYVATTIAVGFAAGAAAMYDAHHGASISTATAVNDIRNFAYFLSGGVAGMFAIFVGVAGRVTGALPRWLCWAGMAVGTLGIAAVPAAQAGLVNGSTMLWFAWVIALGITALRSGRIPAARRASVPATA